MTWVRETLGHVHGDSGEETTVVSVSMEVSQSIAAEVFSPANLRFFLFFCLETIYLESNGTAICQRATLATFHFPSTSIIYHLVITSEALCWGPSRHREIASGSVMPPLNVRCYCTPRPLSQQRSSLRLLLWLPLSAGLK